MSTQRAADRSVSMRCVRYQSGMRGNYRVIAAPA